MIKETVGNALTIPCNFVAHQVNCRGKMGAGIAKAIKEQTPPEEYEKYVRLCKEKTAEELLGQVQFMQGNSKTFCNVFGQDNYSGFASMTDYNALARAFDFLLANYDREDVTICIPGYLGCGLAGGSWNIVFDRILLPRFAQSRARLIICYMDLAPLRDMFAQVPKDGNGRMLIPWHGFEAGLPADTVASYLDAIGKF